MCGRFFLADPAAAFRELFGVSPPEGAREAVDLVPGRPAAVLRGPAREPAMLRWGLVPHWSRDPSSGPRPFNARIETVAVKPAFRDALRARRCLVPADAFLEWSRERPRRPWLFRLPEGAPMAFAGLWERWDRGAVPLETFTILTTRPNERVAAVHDRMPVIVPPEAFEAWLAPGPPGPGLLGRLAEPWPAGAMEALPWRGTGTGVPVYSPRHEAPTREGDVS